MRPPTPRFASTALAAALSLALASLTTAFSLTDLEPLQSLEVSATCNSAYSANIAACPSASSFLSKQPCSSACTTALGSLQMSAQLACENEFSVTIGGVLSLLQQIQNGNLVDTLCPSSSSASSSSSVASSVSSALGSGATATSKTGSGSGSGSTKTASTTASTTAITFSGTLFASLLTPPPPPPPPQTATFSGVVTLNTSYYDAATRTTGLEVDTSSTSSQSVFGPPPEQTGPAPGGGVGGVGGIVIAPEPTGETAAGVSAASSNSAYGLLFPDATASATAAAEADASASASVSAQAQANAAAGMGAGRRWGAAAGLALVAGVWVGV